MGVRFLFVCLVFFFFVFCSFFFFCFFRRSSQGHSAKKSKKKKKKKLGTAYTTRAGLSVSVRVGTVAARVEGDPLPVSRPLRTLAAAAAAAVVVVVAAAVVDRSLSSGQSESER